MIITAVSACLACSWLAWRRRVRNSNAAKYRFWTFSLLWECNPDLACSYLAGLHYQSRALVVYCVFTVISFKISGSWANQISEKSNQQDQKRISLRSAVTPSFPRRTFCRPHCPDCRRGRPFHRCPSPRISPSQRSRLPGRSSSGRRLWKTQRYLRET